MSALRQINNSNQIITKASEHYELLHDDNKHTAIVWAKNEKEKWHKVTSENSDFIDTFNELQDVYISVNQFYSWRHSDLLKSLRACFVDIDDEKMSRYELNEIIDNSQMPRPSVIVFSGRGWHLYWLLEHTPRQALDVWKLVQAALIKAFNADKSARDCARVLRLIGSVNSKNGAKVLGYVLDAVPWRFHDLCNEVLGYRNTEHPKQKAKILDLAVKKAESGHVPRSRSSIKSWWYVVYQDLHKIAQSYSGGIPEGHRNNFIFIVSVAMSWFSNIHSIEQTLKDRANKWTAGLTDSELTNAISASLERLQRQQAGERITYNGREVDPRYHYRRSTIYEMLAPLIKDEIKNDLRAIVSDETRTQRRAERASEYELIRAKRDRVAEGKYTTRHSDSIAQQKPWESLGISRATWYRRQAKNK